MSLLNVDRLLGMNAAYGKFDTRKMGTYGNNGCNANIFFISYSII